VAYDVPGPRDILGDKQSGSLVAAGDVDRFSDAIVDIFERGFEHYKGLSERSAQTAVRFSWPAIARNTIEEYRRRLNDVRLPSSGRPFSDARV
jgi:glycosyltransferase involved in cell wall biosynthesis